MLVAFLLPTVVQFLHTFKHHEHTVYISKKEPFLYKANKLDCAICNFTLSIFICNNFYYNLKLSKIVNEIFTNYYNFLSVFKKLHFSLRAPPIAV